MLHALINNKETFGEYNSKTSMILMKLVEEGQSTKILSILEEVRKFLFPS